MCPILGSWKGSLKVTRVLMCFIHVVVRNVAAGIQLVEADLHCERDSKEKTQGAGMLRALCKQRLLIPASKSL